MKTISNFPDIPALLVACALLALPGNAPAIDDKTISEAVKTQLKDYIPTAQLDPNVKVEDGVVSITGLAESLPAKKLATEAVSSIRGVKAIVNRLKIREINREDEVIRYDLERLFSLNYPGEREPITATVNDGVVTLKGSVSTYDLKLLSETMSQSVIGVRDVVNLLRVEPLTTSGDDEIRQHIALALRGDPWVEDDLVMINVDNGRVILNGAVDSFSEKSRLISKVMVYGVTDIDTENLTVSPELRPVMERPHEKLFASDEEIRAAIEAALEKDPRVLAENAEVSVLDGDVTLTGSVASIGAKAAVETDARNTPGVDLLYSFLTVKEDTGVTDEALETALREVLSADALLGGATVSPVVEEKVVTLEGEVLSKFQRRRALRIAAHAIGVQMVISRLDIDWDTPEAYKGKANN